MDMATFKERHEEQRAFVRELETVSTSLAIWAQERFKLGWSLSDVKTHIRNAMSICEKN